jgi:hypothetical protein
MYSRDRSSPLKDTLLDGEESLSAAYGWRSGNRSVLMFRRLVPGPFFNVLYVQNIWMANLNIFF